MTVTTVYADASDAQLRKAGTTYSTQHDATASDTVAAATANQYNEHLLSGATYEIYVLFFPFDTSGISASDTISAATFSFYKHGDAANDNSDDLGIVQTVQATWNSMVTSDYDGRGDAVTNPTEGATRQTFSAGAGTGFMDFDLNATGRGWIARTGETKPASASATGKTQLAVRFGRDMDNTAPTGANYMLTRMADTDGAGTTTDPKLVVTHAAAGSASSSISLSPSSSVSLSPSSSQSPSSSVSLSPSSSVSSSISLSPSSSQSPSSSVSSSISLSPSSSISLSPSSSVSSSISSSPSSSQSPSSSISLSPSSSVSSSISLSPSSSVSLSPSSSISSSISPSPSASPSIGFADYTRGDYAALPTDDADLETDYSAQDVADVATSNNVRVNQAALGQYAIHQYKNFRPSNDGSFLWEGQSDIAPSTSAIVLQIYNRNTTTWETKDSNNTAAANTDFNLTFSIADLTNYKNASGVTACRVYQLSV